MKAIFFKTVFCLALLASSSVAYSQIFSVDRLKKRAKDRAEQRAEDNVNNRVDRGVDKVIDGLFGGVDKGAKKTTDAVKDAASGSGEESKSTNTSDAQSEEQAKKMLGGLLSGIGNAPAPEGSYGFKSSYVMKITAKDKKGESLMRMKYYFTDETNAVGTKILEMSDGKNKGQNPIDFMVMDFDKESMYTFMNNNGSKTMMGISYNQTSNVIEDEANKSMEKTSYTKTGQTKTIAGYKCDGYLINDGKEEMTVWISQGKVPVIASYYKSFAKMAGNNSNSKIKLDYAKNPEIYKMAMEGRALMGMDNVDKNEETHMEVESVEANDSFSFSTSGYSNMMDMNAIMNGANQN
ncbi:DUF4412 domain-containing protein [Marinilongibacter aquaticus]|uniref:DUF4412 domain-containing protein n=1 Tax=Marinilongibacter aquaticus TaxID=2975157 RepID=UPI0021BD0201|nr:DUF4412 domain-containing protein [Marinilongibacter aquaticus]UBM58381.1 DUF4412 domain-containing protein [Marinilongibacter aquaticus]